MKKNIWKFVVADIILLVFLFLASSTDFILKERVEESHKITVMMDISGAGIMDNFKMGANKAAIGEKIDVNFIDLSAFGDSEGQKAALEKEIQNGSEGIVLYCEDRKQAEALIATAAVGDPVVLYDTAAESLRVRGRISANQEAEVGLLVEAVLDGRQRGQDIALVERKNTSERILFLHEKIETALFAEGIVVRRVVLEDLSMAATGARGLARQGGNILVSADLAVVQGLGEGCRAYGLGIPLYGMGWSIGCRSLLEGGFIDGLVVHRSYEAGFLAVTQVADILKNEGSGPEVQVVECGLITPENMYLTPIATFLFPYA